MRNLLAIGLVGFGMYWFWKQLDVKEKKIDESVPTIADRIRATLEESGIRQGGIKLRNGGARVK